jgi:hypothetical protein
MLWTSFCFILVPFMFVSMWGIKALSYWALIFHVCNLISNLSFMVHLSVARCWVIHFLSIKLNTMVGFLSKMVYSYVKFSARMLKNDFEGFLCYWRRRCCVALLARICFKKLQFVVIRAVKWAGPAQPDSERAKTYKGA